MIDLIIIVFYFTNFHLLKLKYYHFKLIEQSNFHLFLLLYYQYILKMGQYILYVFSFTKHSYLNHFMFLLYLINHHFQFVINHI